MFRMNPRDLSVYSAKRALTLATFLFACANADQNEAQPEPADTPAPSAPSSGGSIFDKQITVKTGLIIAASALTFGSAISIAIACCCARMCCNKKDDADVEAQPLTAGERRRSQAFSRFARN